MSPWKQSQRGNQIPWAHEHLRAVLGDGLVAIDATAGNGHDTLLLARGLGPSGRVHAFDLQPQALEAAKARLQEQQQNGEALAPVSWHLRCHSSINEQVRGPIVAAIFNLGYLPGADHGVTTQSASTLAALTACGQLMSVGGRLAVVAYVGHEGGLEEYQALQRWAGQQPKSWLFREIKLLNRERAPIVVLGERLR